MDLLTLKIPEILREKLNSYANQKGKSKSEVVREALVEYFEKSEIKKQSSFYSLAKDLAGSVDENSDLSVNKKHLSGYGK